MQVKQVKAIARRWVNDVGVQTPGFDGAFFHGSVNWMSENDDFPAGSDLDVMLVLDGTEPSEKPGKFDHEGVTLEVSYLSRDEIRTPEAVLGAYHLAGSFHRPSVIADPNGWLTPLQQTVERDYPKRFWVERRGEDARSRVLRNVTSLRSGGQLPDLVTSWLFAGGVTTHILLIAGLKNPTVRKRYVAVRSLLLEYDLLEFYEELLGLIGCRDLSKSTVEELLEALTEIFDVAKTVVTPAYRFAADISETGRTIAIDSSWKMIEQGHHREAVFWIVASYCRCMTVLEQGASAELLEEFEADFRWLLGTLGIDSVETLQNRGDEIERFLPRLWEVAEYIMIENPDIEGDEADA